MTEADALRDSVRAMLEARTVAIVGASARPGSFGERVKKDRESWRPVARGLNLSLD